MKKVFFWALCSSLFFACSNEKSTEAKMEATPSAAETKMPPVEFADAKYTELGKKGLAALTAGDVAGFVNNYADNAVYVFNNGDSLAGKAAITGYWTQRRMELMDSINFSNHIFLPIKVNQPQSIEQPGVWLLSWYQVRTKYKTGKTMTQWIHTDLHFNEADQVDRIIQYLDRVPINAAMAK
jgi:hypothetical protein